LKGWKRSSRLVQKTWKRVMLPELEGWNGRKQKWVGYCGRLRI